MDRKTSSALVTPPTHGISLDALATTLRITPSKAVDTLRRLHHHGLVEFRENTAVLGITGLAPDVPAAVAAELSPYTARLLARMDVREPRPGRGPGPIGAISLGTLER